MENPDAVISTGAEIGFPPMIIGYLLRKKIIYVETFARIDDLSLTGKLMYHLIKNFYVQWKPLKKKYPKAIYMGALY